MHPVQNKGHSEEIDILEADDVPLIMRSWLVDVNIGQKTKGKDNYPEVHPDQNHERVEHN